jgi:hypothetical protein
MTELIASAVSKEPEKSGQKRFGSKAAFCIGGALTIVVVIGLWAEISKGSKINSKLVVPESVAPQTVPIEKASRETLTKDI